MGSVLASTARVRWRRELGSARVFFQVADSSPSTWPVVVSIWLLLPLWCVMGDHRRTFGCSLVWPQRSGALSQVVHLLDPPADDVDNPGDEAHPKLLDLRL